LITTNFEAANSLADTLTNYLKSVNAQLPVDKMTNEIVLWPNQLLDIKK
jgi:hypothetical protein